MPNIITSVSLSPDLRDKVAAVAKLTGKTRSDIMREAITQYVEQFFATEVEL